MSRRHIFTERQRAALFDLPTDELSLLKFYTLGDDDLENIRQRRRPENRIGLALLQIVGGDKLIIPFC